MVTLGGVVRKTLATAIVLAAFAHGINKGNEYMEDFRAEQSKSLEAKSGAYHGKSEISRRSIRRMQNYLENGGPSDYALPIAQGLMYAMFSCIIAVPIAFKDLFKESGGGSGPTAWYRDEYGNVWADSDCSVPYPGFENKNTGGWSGGFR